MQNKQQELNKILSRINELEPQRRAMNDEYMVIRCELEDLKDRKDELENEIWGMESEEMLKEDDGMTEEEYKESLGNDTGKYDKALDNMMGNPMEEINQLIDEIKNPEDYANFDTKDLESSIV